jgi:predicted ATPase/transcriptional regulator with XRE-family HTH domain
VSDSETTADRVSSNSFATLLRGFRRRVGLTQEALAERATLSSRAISELERGTKTGPHRTTVALLASALNLSVEERHLLESSTRRKRGYRTARLTEEGQTVFPEPPTPLVGRERDVLEVVHRLRHEGARLLTLTGPGGVGKTRVVIAVARAMQEDCPDGTTFVSLAPLRDARLIASTLVACLKLSAASGRSDEDCLVAHFKRREAILVLDNFEHLLEGAPLVSMLLRACPRLKVIVTSRIPLRIHGEQRVDVGPLQVPERADVIHPEAAGRYPSVRLFVQRARAVRRDFALSDANVATITEICRKLDGIPLAIELAAVRIAHLSPQSLLTRLNHRLEVLTTGPTDAPERQQTMTNAIAWSYSLLAQPQRRVFRRLSVFAGGWDLQAAEAVCEGLADGMSLLERLSALIDASLVVIENRSEDQPRYRMLEVIREYAAENLAASGEEEEARNAHATFFSELTRQAEPELWGIDQKAWLNRLERDHDNLHVALRWMIDCADAEPGMRMAVNLSQFWYLRGHFRESRALCTELLALPQRRGLQALRSALLEGIMVIPLRQGDYSVARAYADEALALAHEVGDLRLTASTHASLGFAARLQGDYVTARLALDEGLRLARILGDVTLVARCLHHLGLLALEADNDLGNAWVLNDESLALYQQIGDSRMIAVLHGTLGRVARHRGAPLQARELLVESISALRDLGDLGLMPQMLYTLAAVDADFGHMERAVRLQAAAHHMEQVVGTEVWPVHRQERDSYLGMVRSALGEAAFAHMWEESHAMTPEQTMAYALMELQ